MFTFLEVVEMIDTTLISVYERSYLQINRIIALIKLSDRGWTVNTERLK